MSPGDPSQVGASEIDTLLETLRHPLRREILRYFENCAETETAALEERLGHIEQEVPPETCKQAKMQHIHQHLPKLSETEWLEYDRQSDAVQYYGNDEAERLIEDIQMLL
jgi:hypothetical protein